MDQKYERIPIFRYTTLFIYTLKTTIFQQRTTKKHFPFEIGGQITDFHFGSFRFWRKFEEKKNQTKKKKKKKRKKKKKKKNTFPYQNNFQ